MKYFGWDIYFFFYNFSFTFVFLFFYKSVCLFFHHTFSLMFSGIFTPLPKVQCPNFLNFWNSWKKIIERSGLRLEIVDHKGCKIAANLILLICSLFLNLFLPRHSKVQCLNYLDFWNPWGKSNEKVVSDL